ncbi:MAG: NAD-dependent DNA ligase LigA [bacterium]|nr:NAD-dependent DNA ligase LigA [bacterium]
MRERENTEKRIKELRDLIVKYDYHYYVLSEPLIDDYEYDKLYRELLSLESSNPEFDSPDSPTKRVSEQTQNHFEKLGHKPKMYSLDNSYSDDELKAFHRRISESLTEKFSYTVEPKIDGTAISLIYNDSLLQSALTRGDGETGDDVTSNVRTIRSIPLKLNSLIEGELIVRGEIFFTKKRFEKLSETYSFSNARNAASGTLKLQNAKEVSKRQLSALIHTVVTPLAPTHTESLKKLSELGLPIVSVFAEAETVSRLIEEKNRFEKDRFSLLFETDGIVIKVNQLNLREKVGFTNKSPKWAFAFKFTPERAMTKLLSVDFQVGRTGVITPVANLNPVEISGTIVKRATLHNFEEINRLSVKIGDFVEIEKSGEIIPKILRFVPEKRVGSEVNIEIPSHCPSCKEKLVKYEDEIAVRCVNKNCPEQIELSLIHFASKKAMNIENMGPSLVRRLIENKIVSSISDIYKLTKSELTKIDRIKDKSALNILKAIEDSKNRTLAKVIYALGIRNVGEFASLKLAESFQDIDSLANSRYDQLIKIQGIGEESANAILLFFENKTNREEIEKLKNSGLRISHSKSSGSLTGLSFVLTGTLKNFSRNEAAEYITSKGGMVQNDVSSKTNYLVAGANPGSKVERAKSLGVKIIAEEDLTIMAEEK